MKRVVERKLPEETKRRNNSRSVRGRKRQEVQERDKEALQEKDKEAPQERGYKGGYMTGVSNERRAE